MVALAVALSPIFEIISAEAPINFIWCSSHILENFAFSERKPYPGCIASAFVISAAAMILDILRYDSELGAGPMQTASSANFTCKLSASAFE